MRPAVLLGLAAAARFAGAAAPLGAQTAQPDWRLEGLKTGFCVHLLVDPASEALEELPAGYRPLPASEAKDLHLSLRGIVEGQPEFASWSPSRLCIHAVDTIRTSDFTLADQSGRRPQLFAYWTVTGTAPGGEVGEVVLDLFSNSGRLIRSARLAGQAVREARLLVGKVPEEDQNGVPSSDDRVQVKVGKTLVTWDGRLVGDSVSVRAPMVTAWTSAVARGGVANGVLTLAPSYSGAMAGALKVEGKGALAKALKTSPTRFAGPAYWGGVGSITFRQ